MTQQQKTRTLLAAALACSLAAVSASAQHAEEHEHLGADAPNDAGTGDGMQWNFTVGGGFEHQFETDFDGDNGEFNLTHFDIGVGAGARFNSNLRVDLNFGYAHDGYDFSGNAGLGAANPWDDINTVRFGAQATYSFDEQWSVFGGPIFGFSAESGADISDSFTAGGIIGVGYRASEKFSIGIGLGVISQIEDSAAFFPVGSLHWQLSNTVAITTVGGVGASGGGGAEIGWTFTPNWTLSAGGYYRSSRFRLDNNVRSARDGVGENTAIPIYTKITWRPTPKAELSITGGVVAAGELLLEDSNGRKIMEENYDLAPFVGMRFTLRF